MIKWALYNFLVQPQYKLGRHILLISVFALLAFRRIFFIYQDSEEVLGNRIYILCIITAIVYLLVIYINLFVLIPHLLLKKKYKLYAVGLFFVALIPLVYQLGQEYIVRSGMGLPHKITDYLSPLLLLVNASSFLTMLICMVGTSIPLLFKTRMEENLRMSNMEQENIKTELERLKKQISPTFLSNILRRCSLLVKTDPEKASDMLMRLGQLLRYQLYDCNRDRVLLSAEINFIREYVNLEQLYYPHFDYEFTIHYTKEIFIPPLLFLPFIQYSIVDRGDSDQPIFLQLHLESDPECLLFTCRLKNSGKLPASELFAIRKRLDILYPGNYLLEIMDEQTSLQLNHIT
ncbi:MAG: histidine kinase [Bacteroides sp.]|nr:histidine kinase [Bacteroides sp.]